MTDNPEPNTTLSIKIDEQTAQFLSELRRDEQINVAAWIRDAIRQKAGLTRGPLYRGKINKGVRK